MQLIKQQYKEQGGRQKLVLLIGDEGAIILHLQGKRVLKRLFAPNSDSEAVRPIAELCASVPRVPIYLLVDVIDQNYVRHDLPPVSPLSIGKLIRRRLERDFAAEDIKGALPLGRDRSGRKDWNFLLISLASTPLMAKWIDFVLERPNPFRGIHLLPVESARFILDLSAAARKGVVDYKPPVWQLLVSHNKVGGFRQVVLRDGRLVFTRLSQPIGETMPEVVAGNVEQEVHGTIEYIKRLGYREDEGLELFIILAQNIKQAIEPKKFKSAQTRLFTPFEAAELLSIEQAAQATDHFGDVVMTAYFGSLRRPILTLFPPLGRRLQALEAMQFWVQWGGIGIAAVLLCYALVLVYGVIMLHRDIGLLEKDLFTTSGNLQKVKEDTAKLPADVTRIIDVVAVYQAFAGHDDSPFPHIAALMKATGEDVLIKELSWEASGEQAVGVDKKTAVTKPVAANPGAARPSSASGATQGKDAAAANPSQEKTPFNFEAEFIRGTDSAEHFVAVSDAFILRLKEVFPGYSVEAPNLPGRISETEMLNLSLGDKANNKEQIFGTGKTVSVKFTLVPGAETPPGAAVQPGTAGAPSLPPPVATAPKL